ncbi:FecR family protein [Pedobacter sp. AW31-3R]|uniref:FecR family protein n=1 Tax=Pedobacter sp. AW31-3R TaxID=3445781 RepID=UPI003FA0CDCB
MEEEKFRQLLDRYIAGEASEEDQAWLESAYVNWNSEDQLQQSESFLQKGADETWDVVSKHTGALTNRELSHETVPVQEHLQLNLITDKQSKRQRTRRLLSWVSAAALVVISLSGILIYRQNHPSSYLTKLPASANLKPGKDKAVLVLANGKKIDLDQTSSGHLADQTGVSISKTEDGQIIYSVPPQEDSAAETEYNTVLTPAGGQYQVHLPDGTKVWLNAASSLTFPTSVTAVRKVKLTGEAYFEVSKITGQGGRVPFIVESNHQKIEVLGTHFNVNAYDNEKSTKTTLLEGSVKINNTTVLKPGEQARVEGESVKVITVNADDYTDWQRGDFILEHNDFRSIMRKIARWYDVEVIYAEDAPEKLNLGGWISRSKNIFSILQVMEKTGKVHFKIEGRRITVTK